MTIVVLLLLVVVWAAVLGPTIWRRQAERRSVDSIGAFHRQLHVLRKTGPTLVAPAHRLATAQPTSAVLPGSTGLPVVSSRPELLVIRPDVAPASEMSESEPKERRPDPYFRPEACRRRRDVLLVLVCAAVLTGILGAVVGPALYVCAASMVALVAYVVMLVRLRNHALEREVKLHYLPQPIEREPALVVRRAAAR